MERWVVLNADGTYEYQGESANSGGNGQSYGNGYDQGNWWIQGETLCSRSALTGETAQ